MPISAPSDGVIAAVDAGASGEASAHLGAGMFREDDPIVPSVGIVLPVRIGDLLSTGAKVGTVHARTQADAGVARAAISAALQIVEHPVAPPPLIREWRTPGDR